MVTKCAMLLTISDLVAKYKISSVEDVETAKSEPQHNDLLADVVESVKLALQRALSVDRRRNGPSVDSTQLSHGGLTTKAEQSEG